MRNLLALLAAVLLIFAGLGWYLDWFKVKNQPAEPGHHNISIDFDKDRITKDIQKGEQKLHQILDSAKDKDKGSDGKTAGKDPSRSDLGAPAKGSAESSEPPLPPGNVFGPAVPPPSNAPKGRE